MKRRGLGCERRLGYAGGTPSADSKTSSSQGPTRTKTMGLWLGHIRWIVHVMTVV